MPAPRRARLAGVPLALAALLSLGACAAAEDAVNQATDDVKSQASTAASDAAAGVVRQQICNLVKDGNVSEQDVASMRDLVDRAGQVGVPEDLLKPARDLVAAGGQQGQDKLTELQEQCTAG
jgi:hypothetical protein